MCFSSRDTGYLRDTRCLDFQSSSPFGFALAQSREQGIPLSALVQWLFVSMEYML